MSQSLQLWLRFNLAQTYTAFKQYDRAIATFRALVAENPAMGKAWRCLAFLHNVRGEQAEAIRCFLETLRLDPDDADTHFNLGFMYHELKRNAEAAAHFETAISLHPSLDRAWYGLGLIHFEQGEFNKAIERLQQAAKLQYFNPYAAYYLTLSLHKAGRAEEALAEYTRVKSFDPKMAAQINRDIGIG